MRGLAILRSSDALRHSQEKLRNWAAPAAGSSVLAHPTRSVSRFGRLPALDAGLSIFSQMVLGRGYTQLARKAAMAAAALRPDSLAASLAAGAALRRSGDHMVALPYLQRAAAADDVRRRGNWELAKLLLRLERSDISPGTLKIYRAGRLAALRAAHTSIDPVIRRRAGIALADALCETHDAAEASMLLEPILKESPDDRRALRAATHCLTAQGRIAEACALYARILAIDPKDPAMQPLKALERICGQVGQQGSANAESASWLVAVGGGIGDILHCTPTIANIARRTGKRVDLLVLADHSGAEFLVRNSMHVNRVWTLTPEVLRQPYDSVFVAHSFGPLRFAFNAARLRNARDWLPFRAGRLDETVFNLEAAKALLGIPYDDEDVTRYFAGDLECAPPREPLVGLHAGSKAGRWLSKRWPYFTALTERLSARGIRVASFGTPDEYVQGSENRTGGTIEEMCRSMRDCSVFVSNDSGPMHIASALGIPVLSLFAPTDARTRLPLSGRTVALALEKDCSPCEVKNHPYFASGQCRCVGEISPEAVEQQLLSLLSAANAAREVAA